MSPILHEATVTFQDPDAPHNPHSRRAAVWFVLLAGLLALFIALAAVSHADPAAEVNSAEALPAEPAGVAQAPTPESTAPAGSTPLPTTIGLPPGQLSAPASVVGVGTDSAPASTVVTLPPTVPTSFAPAPSRPRRSNQPSRPKFWRRFPQLPEKRNETVADEREPEPPDPVLDTSPPRVVLSRSPAFPGDAPDPFVVVSGGSYLLYSTNNVYANVPVYRAVTSILVAAR
ncbi:MAG: hypothetical protein H6512_08750 [Acidimicrobiia bacterium]|nr:hypothetical protein [Acidimicrobiia bacterium]